jgi:hypothetical protein
MSTTKKVTRRTTMILGAGIVPVAALPSMAAAAAADAELLALGAELDGIIKEWRARQARDQCRLPDDDECNIAWDDIHGRLLPLVDDILDRTAQTCTGLAVQTRAWHIGDEQMFDETDTDNQSEYGARYIKAVYRFLQIEPLDLSPDAGDGSLM